MAPLPHALEKVELPPGAREVVRLLQEAGHQAFLVGGCVRDLLREVPPKDFDVATSARPESVQRLFRKVIPTGIAHGTVTVLQPGEQVEVTTFRNEGEYRDGRRPSEVTFHTDIEGDLGRRDFTMNAIAFDPIRGQLIDPYGGQSDLTHRLIRCVGDPVLRFSEDGLRPLRAVRFAAVLGFEVEPATLGAIPGLLSVFQKVSLERVREEFMKLLLSERPAAGLALLESTGLLGAFLPEVLVGSVQRRQWVQAAGPVLEVRLGALLHQIQGAGELLVRMKFPNRVAALVAGLVRHALTGEEADWSDGGLRRWMARAGEEAVEPIIDVAIARQVPEVPRIASRIRSLLAARPPLRARDLVLGGAEIMAALQVGPSPAVGEATRFLFEKVLEHPEWNTAERLLELLGTFRASA